MATDDSRTRILQAAGAIFAEKGFKGATVREICDAAGVNLAGVNYHFGDKERLYIEAVKDAHPLSSAPEFAPHWPEGTSPESKLAEFIHAACMQMLGTEPEPWQMKLLMREMANPTAACRELVEQFIRSRFDVLQSILDEIVPAETPVHERHQIAFSIAGQFLHYRLAGHAVRIMVGDEEMNAHFSAEELADHITRASLAMLGLAPPVGQPCETKMESKS